MSESKERKNSPQEYGVDFYYSRVMGYGKKNDDGTTVREDLDGHLLMGQKITVTPIGDGMCKVSAEYKGKLDTDQLVALTAYNTRVEEIENASTKKNKGCFPKIILVGILGVAVTLALSSCMKGCMAQPVEPTQQTEALVQETTMPDGPEYYEATVKLKEDVYEKGYLYDDLIHPYAFQDIYDESSFEYYNDCIGEIDEGIRELTSTYSYSTTQLERLSDLTSSLAMEYSNQYYAEESAKNKAEGLKDAVKNSDSKYALYDRQVEDITNQQERTNGNFWVAHNAYGVVVNISKAHQDFENGENYVKDVDFSLQSSVCRSAQGTIDYTELSTSGTIQAEYSKTGKTQEELLQQVIEGLQEYEPYMEDDIVVKIDIVDDQGEKVDYISYSGTKEEIIENIKSDFGIQENNVENDGNGNIQSENEAETGKVAFSESDVKEVVEQQKATGLIRTWDKFTHFLHRGQNRSNEGR